MRRITLILAVTAVSLFLGFGPAANAQTSSTSLPLPAGQGGPDNRVNTPSRAATPPAVRTTPPPTPAPPSPRTRALARPVAGRCCPARGARRRRRVDGPQGRQRAGLRGAPPSPTSSAGQASLRAPRRRRRPGDPDQQEPDDDQHEGQPGAGRANSPPVRDSVPGLTWGAVGRAGHREGGVGVDRAAEVRTRRVWRPAVVTGGMVATTGMAVGVDSGGAQHGPDR